MANVHLTAVSRADFAKTSLAPRRRIAAKGVMKVFADYANEHNRSWPHVDTIALEAGCSRGTVSETTEECVQAGLLVKRKTLTGNKYVINMRLLRQLEVPRPKRQDPDFPDFAEAHLHETSPEEETPGQEPFSAQANTDSDQGFSAQANTDFGTGEYGYTHSQEQSSAQATQIPYVSPSDPPTNPEAAEEAPETAGWLAGEKKNQPHSEEHGDAERLLRGLRMPQGDPYEPDRVAIDTVVRARQAGIKDERITEILTWNLHEARSSAAVLRKKRLPDLEAAITDATPERGSQGQEQGQEYDPERPKHESELPGLWCRNCAGKLVQADGGGAKKRCAEDCSSPKPIPAWVWNHITEIQQDVDVEALKLRLNERFVTPGDLAKAEKAGLL